MMTFVYSPVRFFMVFLALSIVLGLASGGLTAVEKTEILNLHNKLRSEKNANQVCTAADMMKLAWDDALASASQTYADKCVGDHDEDAGSQFGENLWMNIGSTAHTTDDVKKGTQSWYIEWKDTVWSWGASAVVSKPRAQCTDTDGLHCNIGHYFQVIWAKASKLGCGVAACSNLKASGQTWGKAVYLVCRYDAPAKHSGGASIGLPYMVGKPCGACPGSCENGLCTSTPTRCEDRSSNCASVVQNDIKNKCIGQVNDFCAKTCQKCTPASGIGYEQCEGYKPSLVTTTKAPAKGAEACKLPALPLNSYWECKTADGCRTLSPVDIGFFMYSIAPDADIQCVAKCKPFSRGALDTGTAIRFTQPKDRVGIAQKCTSAGLTLNYESQAPQALVDSKKWRLDFCISIDECELPALKDKNVIIDESSCSTGKIKSTPSFPASPAETKVRFLKDQTCKVKCKDGYVLDSTRGKETGKCTFPQIGSGTDQRILGAVGPPTWQPSPLPPVCIKAVTSGWLSKESGDKCMNHAGGYTIPSSFKQATGCPVECITGGKNSKISSWGAEGKQKIVDQCRIMFGYDSKYAKHVQDYCCCAKAECFDSTGKLKAGIDRRLLHRSAKFRAREDERDTEETAQNPRLLASSCPTTEKAAVNAPAVKFDTASKDVKTTVTTTSAVASAKTKPVSSKVSTTSTVAEAKTKKVITAETKLKLDTVPAGFKTDPKVKESLQEAIADTLTGVEKEHVTILSIDSSRRLDVVDSTYRRLSSEVTIKYKIELPSTYTGGSITKESIKATTLKDNINNNFKSKGVAAVVNSVEVKSVKSADASGPAGSASSARRANLIGRHSTTLGYMLGILSVLQMIKAWLFEF